MKHVDVQMPGGGRQLRQGGIHHGLVPQGQQRKEFPARVKAERFLPGLIGVFQGFIQGFQRQAGEYVELGPAAFEQGGRVKTLQAPDQPMGGQHYQARMIHLHEHHHNIIRIRPLRHPLGAQGVPVTQGGLIPMVAVGDIEPGIGETRLNRGGQSGIRHGPQPVDKPRLVGLQSAGPPA